MLIHLSLPKAIVAGLLVVICGSSASCGESAEHLQLLKTFVSEFVEITLGQGKFPKSFRQGGEQPAEGPVHEVTLSASFSIAKYEVPQNLYEAVMGQNPSRWKGPRNSAESMTWTEANEFCRKLTSRMRGAGLIAADEVIRLPSESEWEYCCRAGTTTAYSFGDEAQAEGDAAPIARRLDAYAWHTGNAAGNDPAVGVLKPNAWGLYDVHGYLWEFCSDEWHADYDGAPVDGRSWESSAEAAGPQKRRVMRGGSWKDEFSQLRSASRRGIAVDSRNDAIGFRCVRARGTTPVGR
ncbi:MAG TPA: formylglycine-generating enzyme family protein [Caulifigura sp.]|jgi:formylglycine-generating enzyme required for sulfatase activity|nr:formylglycine-generating enzyme family protein [Caulifigura sp.]